MVVRQPSVKPETEQLREKLFSWFQQWVSIFQRSHSPEKAFVPFISQLTKQGILKVEDISSFFFRVCAEASVNSYIKCMANGEFEYAFQVLDAMSRLIVYIIKYHGDASGIDNDQAKVHYLTKILSIFVLVLANMHEEQGVLFQQKPFFRFFSSLISDLHSIAEHLGSAYFSLLIAIRSVIFPVVIFVVAHNRAVTPSVLCNPPISLGSRSLGSALFHIGSSCQNCYYPKTAR
jgi:CCR4-NOT transcription complex subunit 1